MIDKEKVIKKQKATHGHWIEGPEALSYENVCSDDEMEVSLQKVLEKLQTKYTYAVSQKWINKPLAYALYHVWRYVDTYEKSTSQIKGQIKLD